MTLEFAARNGLHFGFGETEEEAVNAAKGIGTGAISFTQEQWDLLNNYIVNSQLAVKNQEIEDLKERIKRTHSESSNQFAVLHFIVGMQAERISIIRRNARGYEIYIPDLANKAIATKVCDFLNEDFRKSTPAVPADA